MSECEYCGSLANNVERTIYSGNLGTWFEDSYFCESCLAYRRHINRVMVIFVLLLVPLLFLTFEDAAILIGTTPPDAEGTGIYIGSLHYDLYLHIITLYVLHALYQAILFISWAKRIRLRYGSVRQGRSYFFTGLVRMLFYDIAWPAIVPLRALSRF